MDRICIRTPNIYKSNCSGSACDFMCDPSAPLKDEDLLLRPKLDSRKKYCECIKKGLRNHNKSMTLVTGAGVSISAGMSNWNDLVSKLYGMALYVNVGSTDQLAFNPDPKFLELCQALMKGDLHALNDINTLESAEYICEVFQMASLKSESPISEKVLSRLLQKMVHSLILQAKTPDMFLSENTVSSTCPDDKKYLAEETNSTLAAVAYLMSQPKGFPRALTYNYDTLLQEYMTEVFKFPENKLVTHVEGKTEKPGASREVFHLHGCVPSDWNARKDKDTFGCLSKDLILSEDSYYKAEQTEAYSWFNSVQSYFLNSSTCVYVGFSGEDYNFRRILRQRGDEDKKKHYLVVTIDDMYKELYMNICQYNHDKTSARLKVEAKEIAEETRLLLDRILDSKERYWKKKGFYPIWVTINDLPKVLTSMLP